MSIIWMSEKYSSGSIRPFSGSLPLIKYACPLFNGYSTCVLGGILDPAILP